MKWKIVALIMLIFTANVFAATLTTPVMADVGSTPDTDDFGGPIVQLDGGDPIPGGPDPGGDDD